MPEHEVRIVREDGFTAVGGIRIHYEAWGAGDPVVLIHGLGASAAAWRRVGPFLAEAGYRVLALDLKGCGLSARPPGDYSRKALASLVCGFMDNLGVRRARAVVGHSMGGAIALEIAATRPERTDLVAVVDGQGIVNQPWYLQAAAPVTPLVGTLASGVTALSPVAPRRFFARMYLKRIFCDPAAVTEELVETYAASADAGYQRAMFAMIQHLGNTQDLARAVRTLQAPTLLIWGMHDPVCPISMGEELYSALPDAELHRLENCGHCPPEERPIETASILVDFFARRGPRQRRDAAAAQRPELGHLRPDAEAIARTSRQVERRFEKATRQRSTRSHRRRGPGGENLH